MSLRKIVLALQDPNFLRMGDIDEVVGITSRDPIKSMQGESLVRALIRFKSGKFGQMGGTVSTAPMSNQPFFHIFGTKVR